MNKKLPRTFYARDTISVATSLLGKNIIHHIKATQYVGKIVEVEAYLGPHDLASHSSRGLTERTKIMFGPPGYAYIYMIYGMYYCLNVVTEEEGNASAVLIRALQPIKNIQGKTSGPGLLCKALHLSKQQNGHDLLSKNFYIAEDVNMPPFKITKRPRIGVDYAKHWAKRLLRFYITGNEYISRK